jgi:hypothetical protein
VSGIVRRQRQKSEIARLTTKIFLAVLIEKYHKKMANGGLELIATQK